jgi:hypothetical protein
MLKKVRFIITAGTLLVASAASAVDMDYLSDLLQAADNNQCIGDEAVVLFNANQGDARRIYCAADTAKQLRNQNCPDEVIRDKLLAAGASPNELNLADCDISNIYIPGGAPSNLKGIGGGSAGGGGGTVASPS